MKHKGISTTIAVIVVLVALGAFEFIRLSHTMQCDTSQLWPCGMRATGTEEIWVTAPYPSGVPISSPLMVTGSAKGSWFFEASFPVTIVDWDGRIIGEGHVQAKGDWMTDKQVLFEGTLEFNPPTCGPTQDYCHRGAVIFRNDNPSGDPAKTKSFELPVIFK